MAAISELMETKFEDSGLMIFSRLPFATIPLSPEMKAIVEPLGFTETEFPIVHYIPYSDATSQDAMAAKGVVYARFVQDGGEPLHLLASHTQADSTKNPGEHAGVRENQLNEVWGLIEQMVGGAPFNEEVVFCGDLNIDGCFHGKSIIGPDAVSDQSTDRFRNGSSTPQGSSTTPGSTSSAPDLTRPEARFLPDFFDRGITSYNRNYERLDYFFRPLPFPNRLATQHLAIAWDIAREHNPAFPATAYSSDHLPLRLDLNRDRCARQPRPRRTNPDQHHHTRSSTSPGVLIDGQMDWFRIDSPGAYGIKLLADPDRVGFVVYGANDLSNPLPPFTVMGDPPANENPFGSRFVLPDPPFLIRVSPRKRRHSKARLHPARAQVPWHKRAGRDPAAVRRPQPAGQARTGAPHSLDNPDPLGRTRQRLGPVFPIRQRRR